MFPSVLSLLKDFPLYLIVMDFEAIEITERLCFIIVVLSMDRLPCIEPFWQSHITPPPLMFL